MHLQKKRGGGVVPTRLSCGDKPGRLTVSDAVQERLNIQRCLTPTGGVDSSSARLIVFGSAP